MIVKPTRFRVKDGKSRKVDEWMKFPNDNMKDVLVTLEKEKMYVETIFRDEIADVDYLYWSSVQGERGQEVVESDHWIDKKHLEYWNECIDPNYKPVDLQTEVVMIPDKIKNG